MKNKIIGLLVAAAAAIAHILPTVAIVGIATGSETTRALSATLLLVSALGLGYIHGLNKTRLW